MSANETRRPLGTSRSFGSRATIYQRAEGLEIEVNEQYDVVQKRVLFDDVLMVTIHREIGAAYLIIHALIALFFIGVGIVIVSINVDAWIAALVFGAFGLPSFIALLTRLLLGVDVVTVFGRRSKTNIRFALRKQRAREVYGQICAAVRSAQRQTGEPIPAGTTNASGLDISSPPT